MYSWFKVMISQHLFIFLVRYRCSSPALAKAVLDGVEAAGGVAQDFGVVSTPQLHYNVVCQNTNGRYGQVGEEGYFKKLAVAFRKIRGDVSKRVMQKSGLLAHVNTTEF